MASSCSILSSLYGAVICLVYALALLGVSFASPDIHLAFSVFSALAICTAGLIIIVTILKLERLNMGEE